MDLKFKIGKSFATTDYILYYLKGMEFFIYTTPATIRPTITDSDEMVITLTYNYRRRWTIIFEQPVEVGKPKVIKIYNPGRGKVILTNVKGGDLNEPLTNWLFHGFTTWEYEFDSPKQIVLVNSAADTNKYFLVNN